MLLLPAIVGCAVIRQGKSNTSAGGKNMGSGKTVSHEKVLAA